MTMIVRFSRFIITASNTAYDDTTPSGSGNDTTLSGSGNDTIQGGSGGGSGNNEEAAPKYNDKQVNDILAKEKAKHAEERKKYLAELENVRKSSNLTAKEKENLSAKIEELHTSMLSKEDAAKREKQKLEQQYKTQLEGTTKELDTWRNRYTSERIQREIQDAAIANDGYNPLQFINQLGHDTRLVEIKNSENGESTGEYSTQVRVREVKDGKPIVLELSVTDAIKRMKDLPEFANFFKSTLASGLGAGRSAPIKNVKDASNLSPADYRKSRKDIKSGNF